MDYSEKAVELFMNGHNCAQATAAAFAERFGLDQGSVLKATAGFGGGRGGLRETCGAVSAMAYVAGLHSGDYAPDDNAAKKALYDLVKSTDREFAARFGTTCCKELLLKASCLPNPDPSERNAEYYAKRPCARFVAAAAAIIGKAIGAE
jgi:C_GCAxxG_C_C family probable redox protein